MSIYTQVRVMRARPMSVRALVLTDLPAAECWHVISLWRVGVFLKVTDPACSHRPSCEAIRKKLGRPELYDSVP